MQVGYLRERLFDCSKTRVVRGWQCEKMCGKTKYLREQCDQVEMVYNDERMDPIQREVTRVSRIPLLSESEDGVMFDWVNKLYKCWLKVPPASPYIDTAVMRSRHTIVQRNCANKIFHQARSIRTQNGKSQYEDKL